MEDCIWKTEDLQKQFRSRYELEISTDQASLIFTAQQRVNSIIHYFTIWEEMDFELSYLSAILDSTQLAKFVQVKETEVKGLEQSLIIEDQHILPQLAITEELLDYYNDKLLPALLGDYTLLIFGDFERSKINYSKAEYKKCLDSERKEIYLAHFRNQRGFRPNLLKLSLSKHKLHCLLPDYAFFKSQMDEPTKFLKNYLLDKLTYYSSTIEKPVGLVFAEFREFAADAVKRHLGEIKGWHSEDVLSEEQRREDRLMTMVLLDREGYGC